MSDVALPAESAPDESSLTDRFSEWGDKASDRMNPILVKETRQALKSRQFTITFMLLLVVAWLISAGGALWAGPAIEFGSAGRAFFMFYYWVLSFAIFLVVPFGAFRSMLNERDHNTYELLSISTLTPGQIVRGKLSSSVVQILIFYSAIAPFIAFTSLLQGFDLPLVAFMLLGAFLWSTTTCMIALMLSTLSANRQWQAFNTIGMLVLLVWQLFFVFAVGPMMMSNPIPFEDEEFWWGVGCTLTGVATYFFLFQKIAISRLTFDSDNRSSGIRVICSLQFLLAWIAILAIGIYFGASYVEDEVVGSLLAMTAVHCFIVGLFASTETDFLSRRIRRNMPKSPVVRLLIAPLMPGGSRGFVYLLLHLAVIFAISQFGQWGPTFGYTGTWEPWLTYWGIALPCYVIAYIGFGSAVGRWGRKITPEIRPAHARVLVVLMGAMAMIAPYLPYAFGLVEYRYGYSLMYMSNPFTTLDMLANGPSSSADAVINMLVAIAFVAVLINVRSAWTGIMELVKYQPKGASPETFSPTDDEEAPPAETARTT
jgi:hypothetical protein